MTITVSVYDFVQGYEAMHFQTVLMMIRVTNININNNPCMNYTRGYKTFLSDGSKCRFEI